MMIRYFICVLVLGISASATSWFHSPSPSQVAFSAGLTHNVALGKGRTLCFNHIFLNIGNAYNLKTGTFTCPRSGVYSFQLSALTQKGKEAWLELTVNGKLIVSAWGRTGYATATNAVIVRVRKGDRVRVQARRHTTRLFGRADQVYTTFSGYLISARCSWTEFMVQARGPLVYFRAILPKDTTYGHRSTIVFSQVEANNGSGYNPSSGVFHVPIAGLYLMKCQLETTNHGTSEFFLEKEGSDQSVLTIQHHYSSKTMSVIIHLNVGDHVLVRKRYDIKTLHSSATSWLHSPSPSQVAFSAGLTHNVALGKGRTLCFNHIFLNIGNAYNLKTGTFTCPRSGVYSFQLSALTQKGKEAWLELTVNGKLIVSAWGRTDYATATNAVIVRVRRGDKVRVQARRHTTYLYERADAVYTTISSYLISAR
ncbi:complement C1q tumor necrosis factor-related protein 4-like [Haliotis rubra]|uniref:complement C1q tumor necrosis factor-related protein 4-like n=1 Tax=Haliotis rubra TaxID=36100 RepID=UPI001EE5AEC3|nr:complement C1q tumor necrosis factor-related protein 4-like [Haliotis rubra]